MKTSQSLVTTGVLRGMLLLVFGIAALAGCAIADEPQLRIGSLPYPGLFTNHAYVNPDALGRHSYNGWSAIAAADPEVSVGIIYTRKAGFIDIGHVRHSMDWTRYIALHVADAMERQKSEVVVDSMEMTPFRIRIHYPDDWWHLPRLERDNIIHDMAIRIGQHVAYDMTLWHEMLTWYDYGVTLVVPEKGSAFTYEDTVSNMLGSIIAGDALRMTDVAYDDAATDMIAQHLRRLQATPVEETKRRTQAVKEKWWTSGRTLKRYMQTGLGGQPLTGWLVTLDDEQPVPPEPLVLPDFVRPDGRDMSDLFEVEVDATDFFAVELRDVFDPPRTRMVPARDFPVLMAHIRRQVIDSEGEGVDDPVVLTRKAGKPSRASARPN